VDIIRSWHERGPFQLSVLHPISVFANLDRAGERKPGENESIFPVGDKLRSIASGLLMRTGANYGRGPLYINIMGRIVPFAKNDRFTPLYQEINDRGGVLP